MSILLTFRVQPRSLETNWKPSAKRGCRLSQMFLIADDLSSFARRIHVLKASRPVSVFISFPFLVPPPPQKKKKKN